MDVKIGDTVRIGSVSYVDFHVGGTSDWLDSIDTVVSCCKSLMGKSFSVADIEKSFFYKDCYFVTLRRKSDNTSWSTHIPIKALIKVNTAKEMPLPDGSQIEFQSFLDSFVQR